MESGDMIKITKKVIMVTIDISAINPVITAEFRKINQVKIGNKRKKIQKLLCCMSLHISFQQHLVTLSSDNSI